MSRFLIKGEVQDFARGEIIFQAGQPISRDENCVYFVMDGRIHLAKRFPNGKILTNIARIGDVFGVETSFTNSAETWQFTAICTKPTKVYCWNRSNFEIILGTYAEIAKTTIVLESRWLRRINQLVGDLDKGTVWDEKVRLLQ